MTASSCDPSIRSFETQVKLGQKRNHKKYLPNCICCLVV